MIACKFVFVNQLIDEFSGKVSGSKYSANSKLEPVLEAIQPSISAPQQYSLPRRSCMRSMAITREDERSISSSTKYCMRKRRARGRFTPLGKDWNFLKSQCGKLKRIGIDK